MKRFIFAILWLSLFVFDARAIDIKQGSTSVKITFLMTSSTDHSTPATGLSPTVVISKNGGAFTSPTGAISEVANGFYTLTPSVSDTGTMGDLIVHATATGADITDKIVTIVGYDPNVGTPSNLNLLAIDGSGRIQVQPGTATGQLNITSGNLAGAVPSVSGSVGSISGVSFPANFSAMTIASGKVAATVASGDDSDAASTKATIGSSGSGLTAIGDSRLANLDVATSTRLAASDFTSSTPPSASSIATAVWQDPLSSSDFLSVGSSGALLKTLLPPPATVTVSGFSNGVTVPLPEGSGTGQILLTNGQVTATNGGSGSSQNQIDIAKGTVTASSSPSSFTATLSANASGIPASYVGKIVYFQAGGTIQQRGYVQSVVISGSAGAYSVTFTMNTAVAPSIQTTPSVGDLLSVF